ncbi:MAG: preprotein translocase subunit SecG [Candidatus Brocadiales bacterium]
MKLNPEKLFKWGIAIVIIFGIIGTLFRLKLVTPLFVVLILTSFVLILMILLQAGKGGGLAALGGLSDQTAFGTKTGTFLSKVTYLAGAVFIVATVCLTKVYTARYVITLPPVSEAQTPVHGLIPTEERKPVEPPKEVGHIGMKTVQETDESVTPADKASEVPEATQKSEQHDNSPGSSTATEQK